MAIILVSLLAVSAVNATDNDTNDMVNVGLALDEVNEINDESLIVGNEYECSNNKLGEGNDEVILSNGSSKSLNGGTFDDIQKIIDESHDGDVIELRGNYQSNGSIINVNKNLTINGVNGTVLDGKNISGFFYWNSQNQIILNGLTFIDSCRIINYYAMETGHGQFINCNFINNNVLNCNNLCNFVNCSFKDSMSVLDGGDFINSSFLNISDAGAISGGKNIVNCSFVNNFGMYGSGAISNVESVINCSFINNTGGDCGAIHGAGDVINCKFINNLAKHSNRGGTISDVGDVINCLFENNIALGSYLCCGCAVYNSRDIINSIFINNSVSGSGSAVLKFGDIINCSFINNSVSDLYIHGDISEFQNGSIKNSNFINTKIDFHSSDIENCTFDNSRLYDWNLDNCKIIDCNFTNQVSLIISGNTSIINCNFTGPGDSSIDQYIHSNISDCNLFVLISDCNFFNLNHVKISSPYPQVINSNFNKIGAFGFESLQKFSPQLINCSFVNNNISLWVYSDSSTTIKNCNFINNSCKKINNEYKYNCVIDGINLNIDGCNFINNSDYAISTSWSNITNCNFVGHSGISAVFCYDTRIVNCNFTKNSAHNSELTGYGGALDASLSIIKNCMFIGNSADNGGAIRSSDSLIDGCTFKDNIATCHGSAIEIPAPDYSLNISNCLFLNNHAKLKKITMGYPVLNYANSAIVKAGNSSGLKITNCTGLFNNDEKYKTKTYIVAKYVNSNEGKYLKITLGNSVFNDVPISGLKIKIKLNGKTYTRKTDNNGQIKLLIDLPVNTYTAKITFSGNNFYLKSSKYVKITVKKATPKLTAKAKTFKKSVKTKKYTITLKTNKNKAMKNTKVTLKVNKKTYTAKTNKKGVATFKIKKLTKKGKYKATVTFKGNAYYNKVIKKVNIKIK